MEERCYVSKYAVKRGRLDLAGPSRPRSSLFSPKQFPCQDTRPSWCGAGSVKGGRRPGQSPLPLIGSAERRYSLDPGGGTSLRGRGEMLMRQTFLVILYLLLLIVFAWSSSLMAATMQQKSVPSLGLVMPQEFSKLSDKEKELYVSGVVDGQSFLMYGASDSNLEPFVRCIESTGIKRVKDAAEVVLRVEPGELKNPMPWSIARAVGVLCKEFIKKGK